MSSASRVSSSKANAIGEETHDERREEAELRLKLALEAAGIGVWEYDVSTARLTWDDRVRAVAEVAETTTPTWAEDFVPALHPDDREMVATAFGKLIADGAGSRLSIDCRIVGRRTGRLTWAALEGRCLASKGGGLRVIGTARDVNGERLAREELQNLNERLEQRVIEVIAERQIWADMFEGSEDPVAAVDMDLKITAMNRAYRDAFARLFRTKLNIGDSLADALEHMPAARDAAVALWGRALAGEVIDIARSREQGPSDSYFDIKFRPLRDRRGAPTGAYQYSRDVTHRVKASARLREAEQILQRAQKMESLGQLTGGVAHDFNNLLQVIGGNLQLLKKDVAGNERAERRIGNALAGVSRGAKLASQLLAFGRRQPLEPKVVSLGRFLHGMDDMLRRTLGEEVELETTVAGGLWNTLVDPNQFENAVLNLAINARDAMAGPGRLTIEAGNAFLDDDYARSHGEVEPGQYVMIAVTDTGSGMDAEILAKVFEPFFTTKPDGKGTGLGLSMVFGLTKQSGGHIKIYSEVGEGTTVRLYLPRSRESEDALEAKEAGPVQGGVETILVVEDDEEVRDTAVALLSDLGYRVLKAPDAASGLAVLQSGAAIDILFTDVVMPGPLRSPELARQAKVLNPDIAVLFTSGYTENAIVHGGRLDAGVDLLSKPYSRDALARKLRQVLEARSERAMSREAANAGAAFPPGKAAPLPEPECAGCALVVEDNEVVRVSTAEMLTGLGFKVVSAEDAPAARLLLTQHRIDLLVADRGLPGVSGEDLAAEAIRVQPELRVIFATGEEVGVPNPAIPDAVYLVKPYTVQNLRSAIAAAWLTASGGATPA